MTLDELQEVLDAAEVAVSHMGWCLRTAQKRQATRWAVLLTAAFGSTRWTPEGLNIRGIGPSLEAAMEDALTKLAADALTKLAADALTRGGGSGPHGQ